MTLYALSCSWAKREGGGFYFQKSSEKKPLELFLGSSEGNLGGRYSTWLLSSCSFCGFTWGPCPGKWKAAGLCDSVEGMWPRRSSVLQGSTGTDQGLCKLLTPDVLPWRREAEVPPLGGFTDRGSLATPFSQVSLFGHLTPACRACGLRKQALLAVLLPGTPSWLWGPGQTPSDPRGQRTGRACMPQALWVKGQRQAVQIQVHRGLIWSSG